MRWVVVLVVLVTRLAWAGCESKYPDNCRILFRGGVNVDTNQNQCTELGTPTAFPPAGKQYFYCKPGAGICAVDSTGTERCSGTGTGGTTTVFIGATPPASPSPGWLWWDTISGNLFIWYNDGTSSQWVPATATSGGGCCGTIQSSLAPFACTATRAGVYQDVDCQQVCVCAGWLTTPAWCRSDTGACGTALDCCTAGGTTTTSVPATTTTTTTTAGTSTTTAASTTTTTTLLVIPAALASDANCPTAGLPIPSPPGNDTTGVNTIWAAITCPTPSSGAWQVKSISFYATTAGTVGAHQTCSVYIVPAGYIAGSSSIPKLAAGCDTVEWTAPSTTINGWVTLATMGTCTLASSTRYFIACNQDAAFPMGWTPGSCTAGTINCNQDRTGQVYTRPLTDPWTANGQGGATMAYYMSIQ